MGRQSKSAKGGQARGAAEPMFMVMTIAAQIQLGAYATRPGFVVRTCAYGLDHRNQLALDKLRARGAIYVTGQVYSREDRRQLASMNENSGIGKTEWVVDSLVPFLQAYFRGIGYVRIEDVIPIVKIMKGELKKDDIDAKFDEAIAQIASTAQNSEVIVVDECHWLFPTADPHPRQKAVFRFDNSFSPKQISGLKLIADLMNRGKKFIFISWLHPQDISLMGSETCPDRNYYMAVPEFLMFFDFPVFELKSEPIARWEPDG